MVYTQHRFQSERIFGIPGSSSGLSFSVDILAESHDNWFDVPDISWSKQQGQMDGFLTDAVGFLICCLRYIFRAIDENLGESVMTNLILDIAGKTVASSVMARFD